MRHNHAQIYTHIIRTIRPIMCTLFYTTRRKPVLVVMNFYAIWVIKYGNSANDTLKIANSGNTEGSTVSEGVIFVRVETREQVWMSMGYSDAFSDVSKLKIKLLLTLMTHSFCTKRWMNEASLERCQSTWLVICRKYHHSTMLNWTGRDSTDTVCCGVGE